MTIQAVLFDKNKWTTVEARNYLKKHRYVPIKYVHKTNDYLRYRLQDPDLFKSFITKDLGNGIKLVIGIN